MRLRISLIALLGCILILGAFLFSQALLASGPEGPPYHSDWISDSVSDSLLFNIEEQIHQAFARSMVTGAATPMQELLGELEAMSSRTEQNLVVYWMSYLQFYEAIHLVQMEKEEAAIAAIEASIKGLKKLKEKNSEDYALLAMVESFSIQFSPGMKAAIISSRVRKYGERALAIDAQNPRAYFVLASNDYYTPEQYGGGQKAEGYLKQALDLPAQATPNPYLPSWGRSEAHEMLIRLLMKQERWEEAKAQFQVARSEFPDSYTLNQLGGELVGR